MPSTYAVLGYSPHTVLLGRGFPPRLPHGELHFIWHFIITLFITFFLTFPQRGVRRAIAYTPPTSKYFNPRTPCGVRRPGPGGAAAVRFISIHAPLTGCDLPPTAPSDGWGRHFNPRTPCGVRPHYHVLWRYEGVFQSTHPLRGATVGDVLSLTPEQIFQSTHPLRGATSMLAVVVGSDIFQSTHPLRGATRRRCSSCPSRMYFNPRTPCGVRHSLRRFCPLAASISIHAPLAGCDGYCWPCVSYSWYFNPRTPCGVRPRIL